MPHDARHDAQVCQQVRGKNSGANQRNYVSFAVVLPSLITKRQAPQPPHQPNAVVVVLDENVTGASASGAGSSALQLEYAGLVM